jgi:hypothetical protein
MEDIEAFIAIFEAGSQKAAARRLGRSLQSVNRLLASLERSVGVELVRRTMRRSFATEAGLAFYWRVKPAVAEIGEARLEAASRRDEPALRGGLWRAQLFHPPRAAAPSRRSGASSLRSAQHRPGRDGDVALPGRPPDQGRVGARLVQDGQHGSEVLGGLTGADVGPFGRITHNPMAARACRTPQVRMPDGPVVFPFNLIRILASNDRSNAGRQPPRSWQPTVSVGPRA